MKLYIYIQPGASKSEIVGEHDGALKVKIKSLPVDGKANAEVIRFFAELFGVAKNQISLLRGNKSRHKTLEIPDELKSRVELLRFSK